MGLKTLSTTPDSFDGGVAAQSTSSNVGMSASPAATPSQPAQPIQPVTASQPAVAAQPTGQAQSMTLESAMEMVQKAGFKLLRKMDIKKVFNVNPPAKLKKALLVDVEATGKDVKVDKMIEIGALLVDYDPLTGLIYNVLQEISQLEDPGMPISEEATKVNGITDEMVKGQKFNDTLIESVIAQADVVSCHNSNYDRKMLEKRFPSFEKKRFTCSLTQISWNDEGMGGAKLEWLMYKNNMHYEAHRALVDCYALAEVLQIRLPESGKIAMLAMMEKGRLTEIDVAAVGAPFDAKDKLKEREYVWFDSGTGVKYWHKPVLEADLPAEHAWLKANIYNNKLTVVQQTTVDPFNRFSIRSGEQKPFQI